MGEGDSVGSTRGQIVKNLIAFFSFQAMIGVNYSRLPKEMKAENIQNVEEDNQLSLRAVLDSLKYDSSVNSLIQSSPVCHKFFGAEVANV